MNSIYNISEDIISIFNEIEDNEGEITKEQEEALKIKEDELKDKLENYNKLINSWKNNIDFAKSEIKRLQTLNKVRNNNIDRLKNIMKFAVEQFGYNGKNGNKYIELNTCKLYTKKNVTVEFNDERLNILKEEFISVCKELYKEGCLHIGNNYEDMDFKGIIDMINMNCIVKYGEDFKHFTLVDLESIDLNINIKISLSNLLNENNSLLESIIVESFPIKVEYDKSITNYKYNICKFTNENNKPTCGILKEDNSLCLK